MTPNPQPSAPVAEKPFFWVCHPHTGRRIALVSADGDTDILLSTGDSSTAWAEISEENADLLASLPVLRSELAQLKSRETALRDAARRVIDLWYAQNVRRRFPVMTLRFNDDVSEKDVTGFYSAMNALNDQITPPAPDERAAP